MSMTSMLIFSLLVASNRAADEKVDFAKEIEPLFRSRCFECHGSNRQRGGLRLDRKKDALAGGDNGKILVPGDPAKSDLVHRIMSVDRADRMPPQGDRLTKEQVQKIATWIRQGAPWPENQITGADPQKKHWAFQPVHRPKVPGPLTTGENPLDAFLTARLTKAGLKRSPSAERATLIRRLSFNLIGLPPSPEEVDQFVNDTDPMAYRKLVDRLLASPRYGERWARHWLDVVRFAESDGFETNLHRPSAWVYRDYVIQSFNEDKPFDRFIFEQLAGDTVGVDAGTGFLVAGPWDRVKSPDPQLTMQQRSDELNDMINTTGTTFLGLTLGCARCHDHKFDPVSMVDYYGLQAILTGVQHGERAVRSMKFDTGTLAKDLRRRKEELDRKIVHASERPNVNDQSAKRPSVDVKLNVDRFPPVATRKVRFTILATNAAEPCIDELEIFSTEAKPRNVALAALGARASASSSLPGYAIHKLEHLHDGQFGNGRSWISNEPGRGWVTVEFAKTEKIDRVVWARDREGKFADRLATAYRIEVESTEGKWHEVASSRDRIPYAKGSSNPVVQALVKERDDVARRIAELEKGPMGYVGRFTAPEPTHRLHRGDVMQKREPIAPAVLSAFAPRVQVPATAPEPDRRVALAKWIGSRDNPLTARVLVNRLWHYHFGTGLVATPSDFGMNGAPPSHPELLDWLADEFMTNGWSIKHVQRLIVTSATFQQSSRGDTSSLAVDAQSRLLWRFPPRRLEAEPLRDSILAVSGKLDLKMGGPGFDLFEPNSNYVKVYTPKKSFGPAEFRRLVYQSKPRMQPDDTFCAFDRPDGGQVTPARNVSTTPLQALNLLNAPFLLQQAQFFADRVAREHPNDPRAQVTHAFRLALQRNPSSEESTAALELVREHGFGAFTRALLNSNEFLYVD